MNRRTFLKAVAAAPAVGLLRSADAAAELPKAKITRVRIYRPPNFNPLFNQGNMVVTVETDIDRTKKIFRKRGWIRRFFEQNGIQAGDRVLIERLDPYHYRVSKA